MSRGGGYFNATELRQSPGRPATWLNNDKAGGPDRGTASRRTRQPKPKHRLIPSAGRPGSSRPTGSSFAARFGRIILQHGVAALPSALYHYQGELDLSVVQTWFISYILTHKWDSDLPYPSLHKMARCTGMSYVNLQRIKSRLCDMHYLKVVRPHQPKRRAGYKRL